MKRAVPQDANPIPLSAIEPLPTAIEAESSEESSRQTLPEANRRVRTSAAMLGLAISVGAYGLVAPQQGDAAVAAEPVTSDPASNSDATPAVEVPTLAESTIITSAASSTTTHIVQDGQTLWKIAELYGIDAAKLANMNGLQPNAVLQVGQSLQVPAGNQTATAISGVALKSLPDLKAVPVIPAEPTAVQSKKPASPVQPVQKAVKEPQTALQELKQNRDRLKQSLAELKSEESGKNSRVASASVISPSLVSYQVSPGDTLSSIAQAHGVSVGELAKLNQLTNPNLVKANQFIKVPQLTAQPIAAQPIAAQPEAPAEVATPVELPTVPSLASTQNATSADLPLAVGGDAQQFAFRPGRAGGRVPAGQPVDVPAARSSDQYVNNLMSEISRLRERYQGRSGDRRDSRAVAATSNPSSSASRRVSSAFQQSLQAAALQTQGRSVEQVSSKLTQTRLERMLADAPKPRTQVIAAAPIGSESYKPILRSPVGKTVSPNLPPLGGSENYLPDAQMKGYIWPAKGVLTSGYGPRWGRMHRGIDIAAPVGTPIVAAAPGRVITAGWNDGGYGKLVEIEHADGSVTLYAHNNRILVRVGQQVRQGQQIAEMGSTGFSTGPHSHFEVHLPGRGAVNPIAHLPQNRS